MVRVVAGWPSCLREAPRELLLGFDTGLDYRYHLMYWGLIAIGEDNSLGLEESISFRVLWAQFKSFKSISILLIVLLKK